MEHCLVKAPTSVPYPRDGQIGPVSFWHCAPPPLPGFCNCMPASAVAGYAGSPKTESLGPTTDSWRTRKAMAKSTGDRQRNRKSLPLAPAASLPLNQALRSFSARYRPWQLSRRTAFWNS